MRDVIDLTNDDDEASSPEQGASGKGRRLSTRLHPTARTLLSNVVPVCLPTRVSATVTGLAQYDHRLLVKKRAWLQSHTIDTAAIGRRAARASTRALVDATLVFAQEEAGTAVCISPNGLLLTCSHCVAESEPELDWSTEHWLLFSSGLLVSAVTLAWDPVRDLALLLVRRFSATSSCPSNLPYATFSLEPPRPGTRLFCVGHPGSEDLESSTSGTPTGYDTLVLSTGTYRGLDPLRDPQDNADIGALKHTCWTYWGHSGAPLADARTGFLVGLHSSWDEGTGMRRGAGSEAIRGFIDEVRGAVDHVAEVSLPVDWTWCAQG